MLLTDSLPPASSYSGYSRSVPSKTPPALLALPAVVLALVLAFTARAATGPPVITQAAISKNSVVVLNAAPLLELRFNSVINVGSGGGPLTLFGQRQDSTVNTMDAFQTVGGTNELVGALQYNYYVTHQHCHYL